MNSIKFRIVKCVCFGKYVCSYKAFECLNTKLKNKIVKKILKLT